MKETEPEIVLDDEHLFGKYLWNAERAEYHREQAEKAMAELVLRGVMTEYPYA